MNATEALFRLKSGDESAFDAFYEDTRRKVYYAAYSIVRNKELAEDVMQETYVAFLNTLDKIDQTKNPVAYLVTTAKNRALNAVKRTSREIPVDFDPEVEGRSLVEYPEYVTPLLSLAKKTFSEEEFRLLHLIAVERYTKTETAKIVAKPLTTVAWQYKKLLKRLKEEYETEVRLEKKSD